MDDCKKCKNFGCNAAGTERTTTDCEDYMAHLPTNADRIRHMTDEELAKMLSSSGKYFCHWNGYDPHSERCDYGEECEECWLDWLKQESTNES